MGKWIKKNCGISFSLRKEWNLDIYDNIHGPKGYHLNGNKSDRKTNTIWSLLYVKSKINNQKTKQKPKIIKKKKEMEYYCWQFTNTGIGVLKLCAVKNLHMTYSQPSEYVVPLHLGSINLAIQGFNQPWVM